MSDEGKKLSKALEDPLSASHDPNKKEWVKFEEESEDTSGGPKSDAKVRNYVDDSWDFFS